jgi:hypothetical protein
MAHVCSPSYLGGRDQGDGSLKPGWANSLQDPILKNPLQKRAGGVTQGVGPEFKPQLPPEKKKMEKDQHTPHTNTHKHTHTHTHHTNTHKHHTNTHRHHTHFLLPCDVLYHPEILSARRSLVVPASWKTETGESLELRSSRLA